MASLAHGADDTSSLLAPDADQSNRQPGSLPHGTLAAAAMLVMAGLACVGAAIGNLNSAPRQVGISTDALQSKAETPSWECHNYQNHQDDAWCQSVGVHEGFEFKFVGWNANVCDDCWCCKRATGNDVEPDQKLALPVEEPVEDRLGTGNDVEQARTLKSQLRSSSSTTTTEPTESPTPAPTKSPEQKALAQAQVRADGLQKEADALLAQAEKEGANLRAKARERAKALLADAELKADELMKRATTWETDAWKRIAATRVCADLPGVELKGNEAMELGAMVANPNITTSQECRHWCRAQEECGQSVFHYSESGPVCQWFRFYTEEPLSFSEAFNSSYCAKASAEKHLLASLKKVYDQKAWYPPQYDCAWAGEDCSKSRCCANTCTGNKDFSSCDWYTCYVKDEYFAGCERGVAPEGWNGTAIGGHPIMEVPKAKDGQLTQGTSLFCFAVVVWNSGPTMIGADGEGEVANGWKSRGLHILQCEEHMFVEGWPTGSVHNIDSFVHAWQEVRKDGRWINHDWIVKADVDAVFFPERLRWHIEGLRTPRGAPVYLRNTYYKFHFMGSLEVMTKEALTLYYERSWQCEKHVGREGGEDYWLLQCLEGIGVNYQSDFDLLFDKYAAQNGCDSDWAVAFHFYKSVGAWNECHDTSQNNWYNNHQAELVMK